MTKAAVAALIRGLARDLGSRGITLNTVQPGPTETDMNPDENIRAVLRPMLALGRQRQRNCQPDRLSGETGSELRHRSGVHHRWRPSELNGCPSP
jgi:NAD(P)-dependent dehydrogenase (short-subunit alcohol dehydrogenase family)